MPTTVPGATEPALTDWQPDAWKSGNWVAVQKHRPFRYNLNPMMTDNLFDIPFDGQTAITAKVTPTDTPAGYVGQTPDGGFLATAPWVMPDPVRLPLRTRRAVLAARALAPAARGPGRTAYRAVVLDARLEQAPAPPPAVPVPRLALRVGVTPVDADAWLPALVTGPDGRLWLAAVVHHAGRGQIVVAYSEDGGRTFVPSRPASWTPMARRSGTPISPSTPPGPSTWSGPRRGRVGGRSAWPPAAAVRTSNPVAGWPSAAAPPSSWSGATTGSPMP